MRPHSIDCCTSGDGTGMKQIFPGMGGDGVEVLQGWVGIEAKLHGDGWG